MAKIEIAKAGTAIVDGKEWPARKLEDGTIQRSNRSDPRKGKWLDITDGVATGAISFEWVAPTRDDVVTKMPIQTAEDFLDAAAAILNGDATEADFTVPGDVSTDPTAPVFELVEDEDEDEDEDEESPSTVVESVQLPEGTRYVARVYDRLGVPALFARNGDRFPDLPLETSVRKEWFENRELLTAWGERELEDEAGETVTDYRRRLTVARADIIDTTTDEVVASFDPRIAAKARLATRREHKAQLLAQASTQVEDEVQAQDDATSEDANVDA